MEVWDLYDEKENSLNQTIIRGCSLPPLTFHLVVEVFLEHEDGEILLMRRSLEKKNYPGLYEATAGGSVLKGETPLKGVRRELIEETGIDSHSFTQIGHVVSKEKQSIYYLYHTVVSIDKKEVTLQIGETIEALWVDKEGFLKMIDQGKIVAPNLERFHDYFVKRGFINK